MADEKRTYVVKPGFTHGKNRQYKAGDTVELTDAEFVGLSDKLELATSHKKAVVAEPTSLREAIADATDEELADALGVEVKALAELRKGKGKTTNKLVVTAANKPPTSDNVARTTTDAAGKVEQQLEAETGKEFVKTGSKPPTLVETDKPVGDNLGNPPGQ